MTPFARLNKGPVSRLWYILAVAVFLLCTTAIIITAYKAVKSFPRGMQFLVPGLLTFAVEQPGEYVIWDELSTFFNGKSYQSSEDLPGGVQITVRDAHSGRVFPVSASSGGKETIGNVKRKSIADVSLDRPGVYIVEASGSFPERVFYLRRSAGSTVLSVIAMVAVFGIIGWVLAPAAAIVVFANRSGLHAAGAAREAQPASPGQASASSMDATEEKIYAMFCHLGALSGFFAPFGNIIVPLILWLTKRESSSFVDMHGKEAVNFQISLMLYSLVSAVLIFVLVGIFLLAGLCVFDLVTVIVGALKAKNGESFRYPLTIRFIR
jgi:uncharacterized Tic20 family protein